MNCTDFDATVTDLQQLIQYEDTGFYLGSGSLLVTSALLLLAGEVLVRPLAAFVGGVAGGVGVFVLSQAVDLDCEVRLVSAGVTSLVCALLALFILKTGLFVLGGVAFGGVAHLIYESLPLEGASQPFELFGLGGWYYIVVGVSGVAGAVISQLQRTWFVRISTSMLGGGGIALATWLLAERSGSAVHPLVLLGITVACTVIGVYVQQKIADRKKDAKEHPRRRRATEKKPPPVVVGEPVDATTRR